MRFSFLQIKPTLQSYCKVVWGGEVHLIPPRTAPDIIDANAVLFDISELYSHHTSHQLSADTSRLTSVASSPYGLPTPVTYPTALLPVGSSSTSHQVSPASQPQPVSSGYQQSSGHQLPPTPNSLVTMMGPNSGNSNPASDQLSAPDLPISSVSPAQQGNHQASSGSPSSSWNLPIAGRVGLPSPPPTSLQQSHHGTHHGNAFASHYTAQGFQQPTRPAPHQPFYGWY